MIKTRRVYEPLGEEDGYRVLVDRLWPRGVAKVGAHIDLWLKEVTPSSQLRKWYGHDPSKWAQFRELYLEELKLNGEGLKIIKELEREHGVVTLLYGAKDREHAHVLVIVEALDSL